MQLNIEDNVMIVFDTEKRAGVLRISFSRPSIIAVTREAPLLVGLIVRASPDQFSWLITLIMISVTTGDRVATGISLSQTTFSQ